MGSKAIKVSEETYEYLRRRSEEEHVSIKEVVDRIARERGDLEDFAGSWEMSDEEAEELRRKRKKLWETWEL
ncbi:MAG: hypothetical protein MAG715_00545 [Methanonatronarchaeales archaeon]|nr:hypothetical protein [Methanonatronarchaeales archaeon]